MIKLASEKLCTGCAACSYVCAKGCIKMKENEIGIVFPFIDTKDCIECHLCERMCPALNPSEFNEPQKAYAAWSIDNKERLSSASGGIAIEAYKKAINEGFICIGAVQNQDFSVSLQMAETLEELTPFKNSKYVFSSAIEIYPKIKEVLKTEKKILVIALPCQIAAIKKVFRNNTQIYFIDIVCHGTTPHSYLKQHINLLEKEYKEKAVKMFFRDPSLLTSTYTLTLYNSKNKRFYERRIEDKDAYQVGYHKKITYRENCYHCKYAQSKRCSDITIADYHGLGLIKPCEFNANNVSLILIHTERGKEMIKSLVENNQITIHERPLEEPIKGEIQLRHPSTKTKSRLHFEKLIAKNKGDFNTTMRIVLKRYYLREQIIGLINKPRLILRKIKNTIFRRK